MGVHGPGVSEEGASRTRHLLPREAKRVDDQANGSHGVGEPEQTETSVLCSREKGRGSGDEKEEERGGRTASVSLQEARGSSLEVQFCGSAAAGEAYENKHHR